MGRRTQFGPIFIIFMVPPLSLQANRTRCQAHELQWCHLPPDRHRNRSQRRGWRQQSPAPAAVWFTVLPKPARYSTLYQIAVEVPEDIADGNQPLVVTQAGAVSNVTILPVRK